MIDNIDKSKIEKYTKKYHDDPDIYTAPKHTPEERIEAELRKQTENFTEFAEKQEVYREEDKTQREMDSAKALLRDIVLIFVSALVEHYIGVVDTVIEFIKSLFQ